MGALDKDKFNQFAKENELKIKDPAEYQTNWGNILKNALQVEEEYRNSLK